MKSISILCPVFKEEAGIAAFHARLAAAVAPLRKRYRVTLVYSIDPAPDNTESILRELSAGDPSVVLLVMSRRFGHQAALVAGMDMCRSDALVMMDSDGQHPPELVPELVQKWEAGADIVQTLRAEVRGGGWLKQLASRWFYRVLGGIGSIELKRGAADFRLLDAKVLDVFRCNLRESNPFVRGLVSWVGFNICYVPYEPARRAAGVSNYRASTLFNFALAGICSFSKAPLRLCISLGFGIAALSMLGGILQVAVYLSGRITVPGWASLTLGLTFLGGVQLFFLGLIGEYVGLIFDEVKRRPRYLLRAQYREGREVASGDTWRIDDD